MARVKIMSAGVVMLCWAGAGVAQEPPVDIAQVQHILTNRCLFCHTGVQQEDGLNPGFQAPKGITFDTPQQIVRFAPQIMTFAVTTKAMPPGNATKMTDEERQTVGAWIAAGAKLP